MLAFGYEVTGNEMALKDVREIMRTKSQRINWKNFKTGDIYYDSNGTQCSVKVDHGQKQVLLRE